MQIQALNYRVDEHSMRDKLVRLESAMREHEQLDLPVQHIFAQGLYARELFIPKGTILVGKIHRFSHLNVITKGDISVLTEHGIRRIVAPCTLVSGSGIKRAGYAHEDTVWMTVHASEETDLGRLEEQLIISSYADLDGAVLEDEVQTLISGVTSCRG
jgi:hypothetical protein